MPMTTDHLTATGFTDYASVPNDNLVAGDGDVFARKATLASGQNLRRGALIGEIGNTDRWALSLSASSDGSQAPAAILAADCDATAADKEVLIYQAGTFNELAVIIGTGITLDRPTRRALRALDIFFRKNIPAV